MHKVYKEIDAITKVPVLHIGDAVGKITEEPMNYKTVGLIGSSFIM